MKSTSLICVVVFLFALLFSLDYVSAASTKRGIAYGMTSVNDANALKAGSKVVWFYNWSPSSGLNSATFSFQPLVWNANYQVNTVVSQIQASQGSRTVLMTFNEPNLGSQSNMTPQQAIASWANITTIASKTSLALVAPSSILNGCDAFSTNTCSHLYWLAQFFGGVNAANIKYVSSHWYNCDLQSLIWYTNLYRTFGKKVILSEFSCGDNVDPTQQQAYMQEAIDYLEADLHVLSYAWFSGRSSINNANLLGNDGQLTTLGQFYSTRTPTSGKRGIYQIINVASGQCLTVPVSYDNGERFIMSPCATSSAQSIPAGSPYAYPTAMWQQFYVAPVPGTSLYKILTLSTGKPIDIDGNSKIASVWDYHGGNNQQFTIQAANDGSSNVVLVNQLNQQLLVPGNNNITLTSTQSASSRWTLKAITF